MARQAMERRAELQAKNEEEQEKRQDTAECSEHENTPPDALSAQPDHGDDSQGDEEGAVTCIADHEAKEKRGCEEEKLSRVQLMVVRCRIKVDQELERPRRPRVA